MVKRKKPNTHQQSLGDELENPETYGVRTRPRRGKKQRDEPDDEGELPADTADAVLSIAKEQREEINAEDRSQRLARGEQGAGLQYIAQAAHDSDSEAASDVEGGYSDEEWLEDEVAAAEDEAVLAKFMAPGGAPGQQQRTLSDIIMERIRAKQAGDEGSQDDSDEAHEDRVPEGMSPKVVEVYKSVAKIMSRYSAGKVPKAFKIIPNLKNWEEVLFLTEPESWSGHATYQATRLFVSNLNSRLAQRFLALVLLPAVRQDIREHQRLHFALFQALKKAAYKPDAFYKGILLPLCQSGTCTLREAVILSSVLKRVSFPVLHSAAALARLASMAYSGVNSFFIRVLLDKKYALPYRVVDALVDHFLSFKKEERTLPVVWHQSLLCFVQRYKHEIRAEDKVALQKLMKRQYHYLVTPEVHRELEASRSRGEKEKGTSAQVQSRVPSKVLENIRQLPPVLLMEED